MKKLRLKEVTPAFKHYVSCFIPYEGLWPPFLQSQHPLKSKEQVWKSWRSYRGKVFGEQPGENDSRRSLAGITQALPLLELACCKLKFMLNSILFLSWYRLQEAGKLSFSFQCSHYPLSSLNIVSISFKLLKIWMGSSFLPFPPQSFPSSHSSWRTAHRSYVYKLLNAALFGIPGNNES